MNVLASSVVLVALISAVVAGCGPICPGGYLTRESYCYKFYDDFKSWADAEDCCIADGGHLVSIHSDAENEFVNLLSQTNTTYGRRTWTGLNDHQVEGSFVWTDGSPSDYFNWDGDEPNNLRGDEQCTELNYYNLNGKWNDNTCSAKLRYICKMPPSYY